jgi:ribosomal protein L31E
MKLDTKFKNKDWPTHKKRVKQIRFLRTWLAKKFKRDENTIKLSSSINHFFHSKRVLTRTDLNRVQIIEDQGIFSLVLK